MGRPKESMLAQCKVCRKWKDKSSLDGKGVCIRCKKNAQIGAIFNG